MWITFLKNKLTVEEYWRIEWDKKIVQKNPESRQKPEHCKKVNQGSNPAKFPTIVKANAWAKF